MIDMVANSILRGARARENNRFTQVESVRGFHDEEYDFDGVALFLLDGTEVRSAVLPTNIPKPTDRTLAPADVHDAVFVAMVTALQG